MRLKVMRNRKDICLSDILLLQSYSFCGFLCGAVSVDICVFV